MTKTIDVLVDLETMGISNDAPVIQISAVAFNLGIKGYATFNRKVNLGSVGNINVDGLTLGFWLQTSEQTEQLKTYFDDRNAQPSEMWKQFYKWLMDVSAHQSYEIRLWGNGILFDNAKVKYNLGDKYPVKYSNDRDVRTIVQLGADKLGISIRELRESVPNEHKHDALSDAIWEMTYIQKAYKALMDD